MLEPMFNLTLFHTHIYCNAFNTSIKNRTLLLVCCNASINIIENARKMELNYAPPTRSGQHAILSVKKSIYQRWGDS